MENLSLNTLREMFLSFFEEKGHLRMDSAPLIPKNDSSLLLINSGMAPLKPFFTREQEPPAPRVTTCQKCIRTPDIENVGKDARHGTYFEMLGNFSFGDYFKHEVTKWAWEFITERLKMPVDRLYVSVYQDDDEAYDIWFFVSIKRAFFSLRLLTTLKISKKCFKISKKCRFCAFCYCELKKNN